jgi:hypothetical protein
LNCESKETEKQQQNYAISLHRFKAHDESECKAHIPVTTNYTKTKSGHLIVASLIAERIEKTLV